MIRVRAYNTHPRYHAGIRDTCSLASAVLRGQGTAAAELTVVFINDRRMTALNRRFLNRRSTTDVLSFPLDEPDGCLEGEVYVNIDQARRQAHEYGVAIRNELARLVVHGVLHLAGFRDHTRREKREMTQAEELYLKHYR